MNTRDEVDRARARRPGAQPSPTTAELREAIDRGKAGDKVDWPDPAAAPLGTDDEAAGTPPTPERIQAAFANEVGRHTATSSTRAHGERSRAKDDVPGSNNRLRFWAVLLLLLVVLVIAVWWAGFFGAPGAGPPAG